MTDIPRLALSIRQPWAWAIVHAGKDIENRSWQAVNHGLRQRGRIAIHAAKGMTREEYEDASAFMLGLDIECPRPADLLRGGIIGSAEVVDVVSESASPWFFGPRGLVLRDPEVWTFIPAVGSLGYFTWRQGDPSAVAAPAKWMLPAQIDDFTERPVRRTKPATEDLFSLTSAQTTGK